MNLSAAVRLAASSCTAFVLFFAPCAFAAAPPGQESAAAASAAPAIPGLSFSWAGYFQALAILCFGLALLWAILWFIKKQGGTGLFSTVPSPAMRVENRLSLGPKKWLFIVRCLDKRLVLGVTDAQISLITEVYLTDEELQPPVKKKRFGFRKRTANTEVSAEALQDISPQTQTPQAGGAGEEESSGMASFARHLRKRMGSED